MIPFKAVPVQYDLITLAGGLDLVTPTLSLPPGVARDAVNFEVSVLGGYTRIAGYERYDGRPNPSDALYNLITVTNSNLIAVGDTIQNLAVTATGYVIAINEDTVVYTKAVGSFIGGEKHLREIIGTGKEEYREVVKEVLNFILIPAFSKDADG